MAAGAYAVGILTVDHGWPFWGGLVMSGVVCAVLGYLIGIVSLRLKGHYFSIFTLCVGYIMFLVIEKWEGLTHGTVGIMGIPAPEALGALSFESPLALYYLVLAFLVASVWVMRRIVRSLLGAIGMPWITQSLQFLQEYRFIVFGPILVMLVIFMPYGVVGSFTAWRARRNAKEGKPHAQD